MKRVVLSLLVALPFLLGFMFLTGQAYSVAKERKVVYRYLAEALDPSIEPSNRVVWNERETPLTRHFTPSDRDLVGKTLGLAWQLLSLCQSTAHHDLLQDAFGGVALERAVISVDDALASGGRLGVLDIEAVPTFFHSDGSLLQVELTMLVVRFNTKIEGPETRVVTRDRGLATLINQADGWRVVSYELTDIQPIVTSKKKWEGGWLAGINYYPAKTPWRAFWQQFDSDVVAADFRRMGTINGNTVRIFLPTQVFMDPVTRVRAQRQLGQLLDLAEQNNLLVVPTLFDLQGEFGPEGWSDDAIYLKTILPILSESKAVAFVDIKNEPDLDYKSHGERSIRAWLKAMLVYSRTVAPNLSYTIGWSSADAAGNLIAEIDLVTYHDYGPVNSSARQLSKLRSRVGDKPIMITEFGASSWELLLGFPATERQQAQILDDRASALSAADGLFVWTLNDFETIDNQAIGHSPWVAGLQSAFGLFASDGREKPAAKVVRRIFGEAL
jgi:hypothetical protein